jgi:hypothetical protein
LLAMLWVPRALGATVPVVLDPGATPRGKYVVSRLEAVLITPGCRANGRRAAVHRAGWAYE